MLPLMRVIERIKQLVWEVDLHEQVNRPSLSLGLRQCLTADATLVSLQEVIHQDNRLRSRLSGGRQAPNPRDTRDVANEEPRPLQCHAKRYQRAATAEAPQTARG